MPRTYSIAYLAHCADRALGFDDLRAMAAANALRCPAGRRLGPAEAVEAWLFGPEPVAYGSAAALKAIAATRPANRIH